MIEMSSFFTTFEFKIWEGDLTSRIILHGFDHISFFVLKNEAEFTSLQCTTFQFLSELELNLNWDVDYTFFSWFFWFFYSLLSWIVLVYDLWSCIFNVHTILSRLFNFCRNFKLVVTSKGQLSCVDNLCIFCIAKWLSQVRFRSCSNYTIFNLDIKLSCHIFSCYRVVCFNISSVNIQVCTVIFICYTYRLNIVCFSEFSCIQPYLVVYFITFLKCLRIDILSFVVGSTVHIWVRIGVRNFMFQLVIIIEKFHTCQIEFRFVQDVFLWVEFWSFWRCYTVVELFVCWICYVSDESFRCSVMFNFYSYYCFHRIVSDSSVSTLHFFNCELVFAYLFFLEFKFRELNVTRCIVAYSFNNFTFWIFKYEAEFVRLQFTSF